MHRTFSVIKNAAEAAEIRLDGYIVADEDKALYEMFGYPVCCPKDFTDFLATLTGQPLTVWVHSYGGDVWAGSQIYAALKGYAGDSAAKITGLAASAASFACMGCRRVAMAPTAEMMIHNPVSEAYGDYREMRSAGERLRVSKETILNAYEIKTRLPRDELAALMDAETWMDAKAALEKGFVDEILYADGLLGVANSAALPPPAELIRRRDELLREPTEDLDALRAGAEALALV